MAADNRLTAEQLAALSLGDTVTIESGQEFSRRRYTTGTVVRIKPSCIDVRCGAYLEQYRVRDGVRVGGVGRAELVDRDADAASDEARRRIRQIDLLYREWSRDRADVERLRRLQAAISEYLEAAAPTVRA